jgi:hypothetical protein
MQTNCAAAMNPFRFAKGEKPIPIPIPTGDTIGIGFAPA